MWRITVELYLMNYTFCNIIDIFSTEPLEDRVSAYEAAISGKMPDVNVFKGVQQCKNKKSAEALIIRLSHQIK